MDGQRDDDRQTGPFSGSFHTDPATQAAGKTATYLPHISVVLKVFICGGVKSTSWGKRKLMQLTQALERVSVSP